MTMNAAYLKTRHDAGLDYVDYLATDPEKAEAWQTIGRQVAPTAAQRRLVEGFTRQMRLLCVSGIWCGDCAQQGPLIQHLAALNPLIDLKWVDRDEHPDLTEQLAINAGLRVPVVVYMAEDYEPVSNYGDRTLTRYRSLAARQLGGACPLPGAPVPDDELMGTMQDWLDELERVHLLLRLSGRLRKKHGD
jgi:hypothetical protein